MLLKMAHLVEKAERNAAESREIAEAQRALIEKLRAEGRDTTVAREMLRAALATQMMFEAHLHQLRLVLDACRASDDGALAGDIPVTQCDAAS